METDDDLLVLLEKAEQEKKPEYERLDRKDDPFDPLLHIAYLFADVSWAENTDQQWNENQGSFAAGFIMDPGEGGYDVAQDVLGNVALHNASKDLGFSGEFGEGVSLEVKIKKMAEDFSRFVGAVLGSAPVVDMGMVDEEKPVHLAYRKPYESFTHINGDVLAAAAVVLERVSGFEWLIPFANNYRRICDVIAIREIVSRMKDDVREKVMGELQDKKTALSTARDYVVANAAEFKFSLDDIRRHRSIVHHRAHVADAIRRHPPQDLKDYQTRVNELYLFGVREEIASVVLGDEFAKKRTVFDSINDLDGVVNTEYKKTKLARRLREDLGLVVEFPGDPFETLVANLEGHILAGYRVLQGQIVETGKKAATFVNLGVGNKYLRGDNCVHLPLGTVGEVGRICGSGFHFSYKGVTFHVDGMELKVVERVSQPHELSIGDEVVVHNLEGDNWNTLWRAERSRNVLLNETGRIVHIFEGSPAQYIVQLDAARKYKFSARWYGKNADKADVFRGQIAFTDSELKKVVPENGGESDMLAQFRPTLHQIVEQVRRDNPNAAQDRLRLAQQLRYDLRSLGYTSEKINALFRENVTYIKDLVGAGLIKP